jgi:selenocysteine lyase/cysteine desulfurase
MLVSLHPSHSGAFGTIHFETMDPGKLTEALLTKHNIVVTPIGFPGVNGIRVSPNVYTSVAEIDRFCEAVESILRA